MHEVRNSRHVHALPRYAVNEGSARPMKGRAVCPSTRLPPSASTTAPCQLVSDKRLAQQNNDSVFVTHTGPFISPNSDVSTRSDLRVSGSGAPEFGAVPTISLCHLVVPFHYSRNPVPHTCAHVHKDASTVN